MAKGSATGMTTGETGRFTELRHRLFFLIGALIVYRIGTFIPVPGIDPMALARMFEQQEGTILSMFNMFSGGALSRLSIFALGIMPYISASIIIQMAGHVLPTLQAMKKEGEAGRRKITQYTRYGTVLLASFQSLGAAMALQNQGVVINPGPHFVFTAAVTLVTGTVFLMWLGEQITERGIGNGISLMIFAGIVAGLPSAVGQLFESARLGDINILWVLGIAALAVLIVWLIVWVERGQRRITVNYAKRQQGRQTFGAQTSHLPLKVNMAGVIPAIFASSILLFPATITQWFGQGGEGAVSNLLQDISLAIGPGQPLYLLLFTGFIIFFCFFYTALMFNPNEVADNLKKSGAYVPGIRPGEQTSRYIDNVLTRLTVIGSIYIASVCLLPQFLVTYLNIPFYLGGTSLLIVVVVVMDTFSQVQSHLMSSQYESMMKKANLKGYGSGVTR